MPRATFFSWGQNCRDFLALPRCSASPSVGCYVTLKGPGDWEGPMAPGDYAIVCEDTGAADKPFLVQELVSGRLWYYPEAAVQRVADDTVPHDLRHPTHPGEGSYVTLCPGYQRHSDAARGPLSLTRSEAAYGLVIMESGQRFRVRSCHTQKDWWYDHGAVRPIAMKYIPEQLRAAVQPGWGDYVALTHDYVTFGAAAEGPLEPGNLGVVVDVKPCADVQGGLQQARFTVRSCHNGQVYRYQEGALHLVVQQLLHAPKVPPASGTARRHKLHCQLSITEPGSGAAVAAAYALLSSSSSSSSKGGGAAVLRSSSVQQVQVVAPGRKYWIAAHLSCKDDDLMLANLKPCAFDLYAPSGRPVQYCHLKPIPCTQQQQQQQQGPEQLVSLASCNGASAAAAAAAAGSCVWYNVFEDELFAVFEWDSAETPLATKPHRVTDVEFIWGVCFSSIEGQFTKQHTIHVQAAKQQHIHNTTAAAQLRSSSSSSSIGHSATVVTEHCDENDNCSEHNAHTVVLEYLDVVSPAKRSNRRRHSSSSSDDSGSSSDEDAEDSGSSSSSSESDSEQEDTADTENAAAATADTDRRDRSGPGGNSGSSGGGAQGNSSSSNNTGGSSSNTTGQPGTGESSSSSTAPPTPPAGGSGLAAAASNATTAAAAAAARLAAAAAAGFAVGHGGSSSSNVAQALQRALMADSTAAAADGSSSSSSRSPCTPDLTEQQTVPIRAAAGSSSSTPDRDCDHHTSRDQQQQQRLHPTGSSSSSSGGDDDDVMPISSHGMLRSAAAAAVFGGSVNIQELMRQVQRQAESNEACWQQGNELAQALAAKAMAAAEELLPGNWRRPRQRRQQQQQQE